LNYLIRTICVEVGAVLGYLLAAAVHANNSEPGLAIFGWIGALIFLIPALEKDNGYMIIRGHGGQVVPSKALVDVVLVSVATIAGAIADYKSPGQAPYIPIATIVFVVFANALGSLFKFLIDNA
jgi:hypothetical protein